VTIHLAIGTDIPHMHGAADGAASAPHAPRFRLSALSSSRCIPAASISIGARRPLPEVFLKAVSAFAISGVPLRPITTANFDFIQHYRPLQNVVKRPTASASGRSGPASHGYATRATRTALAARRAALAAGWPKKVPSRKR